jgi:hypothetical protein
MEPWLRAPKRRIDIMRFEAKSVEAVRSTMVGAASPSLSDGSSPGTQPWARAMRWRSRVRNIGLGASDSEHQTRNIRQGVATPNAQG